MAKNKMSAKTIKLFLDETEVFIEGCYKEYLEKHIYLSGSEYERTRDFKNFLLKEIDAAKDEAEKEVLAQQN